MKTQNKEQARQRTEMLAALRKQHSDEFKHAQAMLKEQQSTRKSLVQAMRGGAKTIPQLAESTGFAADIVLWHMAAMKKYSLIIETGLDESGDYYLYELSKGAKP